MQRTWFVHMCMKTATTATTIMPKWCNSLSKWKKPTCHSCYRAAQFTQIYSTFIQMKRTVLDSNEAVSLYLTFYSQCTGCGKLENPLERGKFWLDWKCACPWYGKWLHELGCWKIRIDQFKTWYAILNFSSSFFLLGFILQVWLV